MSMTYCTHAHIQGLYIRVNLETGKKEAKLLS